MKSVTKSLCILLSTGILCIYSCKKESDNPKISTFEVKHVTTTTVDCGGEIITSGSSTISDFGICWSTSSSPAIENETKKAEGNAVVINCRIEGLIPQTAYYIRAFATNSEGTYYGEERSFITCDSIVIDIDGNKYHSVSIDTQVWLKENLKVTHYANNEIIATTNEINLDISNEIEPKYQWSYAGNDENVKLYGRLYTWYTLSDSRGVCPTGWHIPNEDEWESLIIYLGGNNMAGLKLKDNSHQLWGADDISNNESGFSALPGGGRISSGEFKNIGLMGIWWSSSQASDKEAWDKYLYYVAGHINTFNENKSEGNSVRCIKSN
jgi:uncharacterized protein (TIGR02145 family)